MKSSTQEKDMLHALLARDSSYDGLFYAAVTTTGIFCRPSCPARKPKPENIVFYRTAREALLAGYRPCRRCRPLEEPGRTPPWAASLLAEIDEHPTRRLRDADLRARGMDPAAVRRYFQNTYGLTFHAYSRTRRLGAAFDALAEGKTIDEVVFATGWDSHSGFREAFGKAAGHTPGEIAFRSRTAPDDDADTGARFLRLAWIETPVGRLLAGATEEAICLLEFPDRRMIDSQLETLRRLYRMPLLPGESSLLDRLRRQLSEYFAGRRRSFDLPLEYRGSEFQRRVWDGLRFIPYGETVSYAEFAYRLGVPSAARAVGRANGQNRIAILVPCHRVVSADGSLGGYGGGLWRKLRLLELERAGPGKEVSGPS